MANNNGKKLPRSMPKNEREMMEWTLRNAKNVRTLNLYDSIRHTAISDQSIFFTDPIGQGNDAFSPTSKKTLKTTNLAGSGVLQSGERALFFGLSCAFTGPFVSAGYYNAPASPIPLSTSQAARFNDIEYLLQTQVPEVTINRGQDRVFYQTRLDMIPQNLGFSSPQGVQPLKDNTLWFARGSALSLRGSETRLSVVQRHLAPGGALPSATYLIQTYVLWGVAFIPAVAGEESNEEDYNQYVNQL